MDLSLRGDGAIGGENLSSRKGTSPTWLSRQVGPAFPAPTAVPVIKLPTAPQKHTFMWMLVLKHCRKVADFLALAARGTDKQNPLIYNTHHMEKLLRKSREHMRLGYLDHSARRVERRAAFGRHCLTWQVRDDQLNEEESLVQLIRRAERCQSELGWAFEWAKPHPSLKQDL